MRPGSELEFNCTDFVDNQTYYESAKGQTITRARILQELKSHGVVEVWAFFQEYGEHATYDAQAVLQWLGY